MWPFVRPERRVLIVCTANVCRSPAAEALLRFHLRRLGVGRRINVDSAGIQVAAPGRRPDPRMIDVAAGDGVTLGGIRAREVNADIVARSDHIWAMELAHIAALCERFKVTVGRVELLDPSGAEVPDPFFGSKANIRKAFLRLSELTQQRAIELLRELDSR